MRKAKKERRNQRVRIFDGASGIHQLWMEYAWTRGTLPLRHSSWLKLLTPRPQLLSDRFFALCVHVNLSAPLQV